MKHLLITLLIFALAFAASALLSLDWITSRWPRYALVVLLIAVVLAAGFYLLRGLAGDWKNKQQ